MLTKIERIFLSVLLAFGGISLIAILATAATKADTGTAIMILFVVTMNVMGICMVNKGYREHKTDKEEKTSTETNKTT